MVGMWKLLIKYLKMNYNISSEKFTHPLLKPILQELTTFFNEYKISFFVIGATARDIVMQLHNESSGRLTHDLDIAITINNWEQFAIIEAEITSLPNFTKDPKQKQRFLYLEKFELDIVPFGDIKKEDNKIFWPPDEEIAMSVLGFSEVSNETLTVKVDEEIEVQIASLAGIFILKVVAWRDRNLETNKDADDMAFILQNYLEIYREESLDYYEEIYTDNHTILTGGATLLGKHLNEILNTHLSVKQGFKDILSAEIEKKEESKLINQILESHRALNYKDVFESLENINKQFKTLA